MRNANRYRLVSGEQIWIVNTEDTRFNPVFVLAGSDGKFARQILRNLNHPGPERQARRVDDEPGRRVGTLVRLTPEMREPDLGRAQDSRDDENVDGDLTPPHDALWSVVDALARIVTLREAIADGRLDEADAIGERIEFDLIAIRVLLEERAA